MLELIHTATAELSVFLAKHLPTLGDDWWKTHVEDRLSFQQQRIVQERGFTTLEQLDFAALLRILDQNWNEFSRTLRLPREGRTWIKELQAVRNRWAHLSATPTPAEDLYRDCDTLARVFSALGAKPDSIAKVEAVRKDALSNMTDITLQSVAARLSTTPPADTDTPIAETPPTSGGTVTSQDAESLFKVGDLVALRSDPDIAMPVIGFTTSGAETRYQVFHNNRQAIYYESQLQPVESGTGSALLNADEMRAFLTSLHLLAPSTANLYSLRSGRVQFVPYQYRPVLRLIRADRPRLLIADEVGVGKTIEAGLIFKELRARADITSVLVICPKALVTERKWFVEMKRFDEHFESLDGRTLRHCLQETNLEGEWPERYSKVIIPFSLFDSDLLFGRDNNRSGAGEGLLSLDPPPRFDLVIVDEVHHIRNADTYLHQAVRYFCDNAQAAVFLTATPLQLGSRDLFTLLNVLRPDLVIDQPSFEQMAAPNKFINAAVDHCRSGDNKWQTKAHSCLDQAAHTEWGRLILRETPVFQEVYDHLGEDQVDDAGRIRIIRSLEELYTFSPMINRTRRRDIGEFATRRPETLTVEFTPDQRRLHDDLLDVVRRILAQSHEEQNVNFMMTTLRRQTASCLYGLAPMLKDMLTSRVDKLDLTEEAERDEVRTSVDANFIDGIRSEIETLLEKAEKLDPHDPKVQAFVKVLQDKGEMDNNKAMVFSTFRHTLTYLAKHVQEAGLRFGLVHGGIPDDERAGIRNRFALPKDDSEALDILLSSEVGSEGLDFQFCDLLINYDLPWNPMRIEQRIGRIDRYGQQSESVAIVNLVTPGTVDADIYDRCLMRIGVFHHAVGGSEEILGEITREIHDIADSFTLSPEQRTERLQQLCDNRIRQIQEETALEEKQAELFGLTVPSHSWREDITEAESFWLSPSALQRCVCSYLSSISKTRTGFLLGDKPLKTLRLGQNFRARLLEDFRRHPRSTDPVARMWEKWLKGVEPLLPVTFDQETAAAEPKAIHLNVLHPLVRQAAQHMQRSETVQVHLSALSESLPTGEFPFALYQWHKVGVRADDILVAVASDPNLDDAVMPLLEKATDSLAVKSPDAAATDQLDRRHHYMWRDARARHMEENRDLVQHRAQSLTFSNQARCRLLEDQINGATNDKIRRMKEAELARANHDFERRTVEMEKLAESADIHMALVLEGLLEITRGEVT